MQLCTHGEDTQQGMSACKQQQQSLQQHSTQRNKQLRHDKKGLPLTTREQHQKSARGLA